MTRRRGSTEFAWRTRGLTRTMTRKLLCGTPRQAGVSTGFTLRSRIRIRGRNQLWRWYQPASRPLRTRLSLHERKPPRVTLRCPYSPRLVTSRGVALRRRSRTRWRRVTGVERRQANRGPARGGRASTTEGRHHSIRATTPRHRGRLQPARRARQQPSRPERGPERRTVAATRRVVHARVLP